MDVRSKVVTIANGKMAAIGNSGFAAPGYPSFRQCDCQNNHPIAYPLGDASPTYLPFFPQIRTSNSP